MPPQVPIPDPNKELKYLNAFNLKNGLGLNNLTKLVPCFGSLKSIWLADIREFNPIGLKPSALDWLRCQRPKINPDREMERLRQEKITLVDWNSPNYPCLLKEIYLPPRLLYVRGKLEADNQRTLAVVGTRKISSYSQQIIPPITEELSRAGLIIVSGLAKGADTLAHQAALNARGKTVAVLGSSIDQNNIYPHQNKSLAQKIIEQGGAVISEFPLDTQPLRFNFPQRNRIISGLSKGVLVVEAPEKSGALITARFALEQNRDVFAVPGHIFSPNSAGPHRLIQMGAKLISRAGDILEEFNLDNSPNKFRPNAGPVWENPEQERIGRELSCEPLHIDKITSRTKLSPAIVSSILSLMEISGKIKNVGGNNYVLTP